MAYTLRPMSVGELLDVTFDLYRKNFALFVGISAIPYVGLLLLQIALTVLGEPASPAKLGGATIFNSLILSLASLFVSSVVTAAMTFGVSDIYLNVPTTMGKCFSRVSGKLLRVFGVSFAFGLVVCLGLVLLVVPGVYWAGKYSIAIPAVVLEEDGVNKALDRSAKLTKDYIGRMIVIYFMSIFLAMLIGGGIGVGFGLLIHFAHFGLMISTVLQQVISTVVGIFVAPISGIALTLAYYDQRIRKEGFDLERMMALLDVPPPPLASGASAS